MIRIRSVCYLVLLLQFGCNSHIPTLISMPPEQNIEYQQVKNNTKNYQEQYVRWGGKIISVENKENSTWIEILASPLNSYGRPTTSELYKGRFIARIDGFLDPEHYTKDRSLTIYGKIESKLVRFIDSHPYDYPLVYVKEYHLWRDYQTVQSPYPYPYYFGFRPYSYYYGYRPYPYYYSPLH